VVLTAGIGEKTPSVKKQLEKELKPLYGSKVKFMVVPTNEELLIARDTYELVK
jgi:acetate kinase